MWPALVEGIAVPLISGREERPGAFPRGRAARADPSDRARARHRGHDLGRLGDIGRDLLGREGGREDILRTGMSDDLVAGLGDRLDGRGALSARHSPGQRALVSNVLPAIA